MDDMMTVHGWKIMTSSGKPCTRGWAIGYVCKSYVVCFEVTPVFQSQRALTFTPDSTKISRSYTERNWAWRLVFTCESKVRERSVCVKAGLECWVLPNKDEGKLATQRSDGVTSHWTCCKIIFSHVNLACSWCDDACAFLTFTDASTFNLVQGFIF